MLALKLKCCLLYCLNVVSVVELVLGYRLLQGFLHVHVIGSYASLQINFVARELVRKERKLLQNIFKVVA